MRRQHHHGGYGGIDAFDKLYGNAIGDKLDLAREMNGADAEIKVLSALRDNLRAYGRTKDIFTQYRALPEKQQPKYYTEHKADIDTHRAAKKTLSGMKQPVPTAKTVTAEIDRLRASRSDADANYKRNEAKLKEMEIIRKNLYSIICQSKSRNQSKHNDLDLS